MEVARAANRMCRMRVDGDAVYWTDPGPIPVNTRVANTAGVVTKRSLKGGPMEVLAQGQDRPCYLVVDETHVYFSTQSQERIKRAAKTGK